MTVKLLISACLSLSAVSATYATGNRVDSLIQAYADRDYYTGLLDLPTQSFLYAVDGISKEESLDFAQYALAQIYLHPEKARTYTCQLQEFLGQGPLHDEIVKSRQEKAEMDKYMQEQERGILEGKSGLLSSGIQSSMLLNQHQFPDVGESSIIGSVIQGLGSLLRLILTVFIFVSVVGVTACLIIYLIARSRGTTFTLTLKRDGLTTEF